jgi:DNA polymerase-3 subunit epsilon
MNLENLLNADKTVASKGYTLFWDTETTGKPLYGQPSELPEQPHLVQLAAVMCDEISGQIMQSIDVIIRPNGWTIPDEVTKIHGITTEYAANVGVPEEMSVMMFMELWFRCDKRVAHNEKFDARIMRIALKRYKFDEKIIDAWKEGQSECTMLASTDVLKLPKEKGGGYKWPSLSEAYEYFTGQPLQNAHSAMADVMGCIAVYNSLIKRKNFSPKLDS